MNEELASFISEVIDRLGNHAKRCLLDALQKRRVLGEDAGVKSHTMGNWTLPQRALAISA